MEERQNSVETVEMAFARSSELGAVTEWRVTDRQRDENVGKILGGTVENVIISICQSGFKDIWKE
jgi:hypothetical protein